MLGIGLVDAWHERGIGRLLLRALLDVGRYMGLQAIRLGVNDDNPRANSRLRIGRLPARSVQAAAGPRLAPADLHDLRSVSGERVADDPSLPVELT